MANEITASVTLRCSNGNFVRGPIQKNITATQATAAGGGPITWTVGFAAEENFTFPDCTPGYVLLYNTDTTNYVDWGMSDSGTMKAIGRLKPGGIALFEIKPSATLRAQASTANVNVDIFFLNV